MSVDESEKWVGQVLGATVDAIEPASMVPIARVKSLYARAVLGRCRGNKSHAAKALGVHRRTLDRLLEGLAA